jgi:hypothetical protein
VALAVIRGSIFTASVTGLPIRNGLILSSSPLSGLAQVTLMWGREGLHVRIKLWSRRRFAAWRARIRGRIPR